MFVWLAAATTAAALVHCSGHGSGTNGAAKDDRASVQPRAEDAGVTATLDGGAVATGTGTSVTSLPRFEQIWRREGLGRFEGAARAGVYHVVANDGRSVQAVDVNSGKTLWRTALATPWTESGRMYVADDSVLLVSRAGPAGSVVVRLSADSGRVRWSKAFACPGANPRSAGPRLYLLCRNEPGPAFHEIRELDPSTGTELSRVAVVDEFDVSPAGRLCGVSVTQTWCGRLAGNRLEIEWTQPGDGPRFEVAGDHVVRGGAELVARRTDDGSVVWRGPSGGRFFTDATSGRLLVMRSDAIEVLRLSDGTRLLEFPTEHMYGAGFLSDGERVLVVPHNSPESVYLVDARSELRTIARNLTFFSQATGGVLLSQNVGMSGRNRDAAPLEAYSLVRWLPPEDDLDPAHRVVAVLERFPMPYEAESALAALRPIPGAMAALEEVIRTGPAQLRAAAAAVAARTGDPRFVAALRERLEALRALPISVEDWGLLEELVDALAEMQSPEAPAALLAFWKRLGDRAPASPRRTYLQDAVASSIWRHGAHKAWVTCRDTVFPVGRSAPDAASIGTRSPGVEYGVDLQRRWAAICEAREDTDRNGKLEVQTFHHGDTGGDQLQPYLVLGSGPGTAIDDLVDSDPEGRWLVVTRRMCVHLVDVRSGKATVLAGADGRSGDPIDGRHRAARFSRDGTSLLYIRSDGARALVVQRDLSSGVERILDPNPGPNPGPNPDPGELSRAFFESTGQFVVMEVVTRDTDGDGQLRPPRLATTLRARRCRGPVISSSSFGMVGDRPIQRIAAIKGDAAVTDAPPGTLFQPPPWIAPPYELDPAPAGRGNALPLGPFHWQKRP